MSIAITFLLLAYFGMFPSPAEGNFIGGCWDAWSRCSEWSSWGTGTVWLTCDDKCKKLGKQGGNCVLSSSNCPLFPKTNQCQCY